MSEQYFIRAAQLTLDTTAPAVREDPAFSSLRHERRAVLLLMRHQFRANLEMQTSVVVGFLLAFTFMGAAIYIEGRPTDPFATSWSNAAGSRFMMVIGFAMTPSTMWQSLGRCSTPQAVWPFFTTAADRVRVVVTARNLVALMTLAPLVFVSVGLHTWAFGHAGHAVLYTMFLGLFAYTQLQVAVLTDPIVPFSRPSRRRPAVCRFRAAAFSRS